MSIKKLIEDLNIANPDELFISLDQEKRSILVRYQGKLHNGIIPERPFPISHPEFLILKDEKGSDLLTIKDYNKLEKKSRKSLEELLNTLYFIPNIVRIIKLDAIGDRFEWETETENGKRSFTTRGRRSIVFIDNRIVISDINDNLYQIKDINSLDAPSTKIVRSTF